jgi:hypothetical protein
MTYVIEAPPIVCMFTTIPHHSISNSLRRFRANIYRPIMDSPYPGELDKGTGPAANLGSRHPVLNMLRHEGWGLLGQRDHRYYYFSATPLFDTDLIITSQNPDDTKRMLPSECSKPHLWEGGIELPAAQLSRKSHWYLIDGEQGNGDM